MTTPDSGMEYPGSALAIAQIEGGSRRVTANCGENVARVIERDDLLAVPVIDAKERLVGIVTHDAAAATMERETTEDLHKTGTAGPLAQSVRKASIGLLYKTRNFWLALLADCVKCTRTEGPIMSDFFTVASGFLG